MWVSGTTRHWQGVLLAPCRSLLEVIARNRPVPPQHVRCNLLATARCLLMQVPVTTALREYGELTSGGGCRHCRCYRRRPPPPTLLWESCYLRGTLLAARLLPSTFLLLNEW